MLHLLKAETLAYVMMCFASPWNVRPEARSLIAWK